MIWNGINVDFWSPKQTMNPKPKGSIYQRYYGNEPLSLGMHWSNYIPAIPLDMRYDSFKRRLAKAMAK